MSIFKQQDTENKIYKMIPFTVETGLCIGRNWTNAKHDFYDEGNFRISKLMERCTVFMYWKNK